MFFCFPQTHLHEKGFTSYNITNTINKIKKLKQRFKQEADKKKRSGNGRCKEWKFFTNLNEILGHRPIVQPEFCIDALAKDKTEADEEGIGRLHFYSTRREGEDIVKSRGGGD